MHSYTPQRRRHTHAPVRQTQKKKLVRPSHLLLIAGLTIVGSLFVFALVYSWERSYETLVTENAAKTAQAEQELQRVQAREKADADYREYALSAATAATQSGSLPAESSITLTSAHRDPAALDVVVNKQAPIYPLTFAPDTSMLTCGGRSVDIASNTLEAAQKLCAAAWDDGIKLTATSGFRSYSSQVSTYAWWVAQDGVAKADTYAARPGYSEHQTGQTIDFGISGGAVLDGICGTSTQKWLAENAASFGFIQRYTEENKAVTGYSPECWHFRYVGVDVAKSYIESGAGSLETFWGVRGGTYTERFVK